MNVQSPAKNPFPIHDAEELLKNAEDLLQYGTWVWTQETGTMEWSPGMNRLLGYSGSDTNSVFLDDFLRHLPGADAERFMHFINHSLQHNTPFQLIHLICTMHGTNVRVLTKGRIINNNEQIYVVGVMQEVSRLPHMPEDPTQQRKLLNRYEMFLKFGTWQYDVASHDLEWSIGMYNLFGYDIARDKDLHISEALYEKHIEPEDYQKGVELKRELASNRRNEYFWQYRIVTATGQHKWLETYAHIERDKDGDSTGTFGITRDITRLKLYEHSLESKIKELNRSNAELEEFAYVASHDMQEPLRKLITFSERLTLKFSDVLQDEGQLYLNRMVAATNNMRLLIDNLLDFSRVGRTGEAYELVDLNDVLQKTMADIEVSVEELQASIISEKLPVIEAQQPQMKQLFTNVLSNALKFRIPDVPPQITIHSSRLPAPEVEQLGLDRSNKYFKIDVQDNGIGFEPEYAQRIFQIFQRLHGKAEYPGSGIGLAICKKIVDYHNGLIYASGQLNEGATITIILPEKQ